MESTETRNQERLFALLKERWEERSEIKAFSRYLKNPVWILTSRVPYAYTEFRKTDTAKQIKNLIHRPQKETQKRLMVALKAIKKSRKNRAPEKFGCGRKMYGLSYPLMLNGDIFGFVILCNMKKEMSPDIMKVFVSVVDAVVRGASKELELEDLNSTVRPRAIALSTVHTVHRLMSSTLDPDELLPRIARLSMQVMRANRCSIKLVGKKRKILLPKCTIDLRKEKTKLKKVIIGKYAPGKAVKRGASVRGKNYLATPLIDEDVMGVITLYDKLDGKEFTAFDEEIMRTLAEQAAIAITNAQLFQEQEDLTMSSIRCIAQLLETRPHGSHRPEASFLKLILLIGQKFNMNESEIRRMQYAAMLHDAGQISIPEKVLAKRGELTPPEIDIIKMHPLRGANILSKFKPLKTIVPIILYHHENWDGTGYPEGLKKGAIPLAARILAVVASFEAMITDKPYRRALSVNAAVNEVKKGSGTQFDPKVVDVFYEAVMRKDVRKLLHKELGRA